MLSVVVSTDQAVPDVIPAAVERFLRFAFRNLNDAPAGEWEVGVRIAGSDEISRLHGRFFGDESDTDVMSFPSGDDLAEHRGYLGDIAISWPMAREQAVAQGHAAEREVLFLAVHGLLHLLGHDDHADTDREVMHSIQAALLAEFESATDGAS